MDLLIEKRKLSDFGRIISLPNAEKCEKNLSMNGRDPVLFIRRQIPTAMFQSLIVAFILSRLDYCNSFLYGLPVNLITRLRSVQNATARLISRSEHITPALIILHWLCVPERTSFKSAVLAYRLILGTSPIYLQPCFTRVANMTSRRRLQSSASYHLEVPPICLSTVGKQVFPVASADMWNDLLLHVTSA